MGIKEKFFQWFKPGLHLQSKIKIGPILHQLQNIFASKGQIAYAILTVMSTVNLALGSAGNNLSAQYTQKQGGRSSGVL